MSNKLSGLKPEAIWRIFESICQIPHPSKKEEKIRVWLKEFGQKLNLETIEDHVGNIIIKKPATPGMENRKGVILQGHMDMVPQANSDSKHNFETDPIDAYIDGDWVTANGTTLGSDNGIGVAAALAVLEANNLVHGPIEALITVDEEAGMTGANNLKAGFLDGDILMNLDSEDEGELYIGCAGGIDTSVSFNYSEEETPEQTTAIKISVKGLKGGHSGLDINLGRANSNLVLNRLLWYLTRDFGARLSSIDGGSLRNAIPRESFALVVLPLENKSIVSEFVSEFEAIVKSEYKSVEPNLTISIEDALVPSTVFNKLDQDKLIKAIYTCPNGVVRMSADMEGIVETSTNLAIVKSKNGVVTINALLRSSVDTAKENLCNSIRSTFELIGAKVVQDGEYPGWNPNVNSPILASMKKVYEGLYGKTPEVKVIHAGLECGILAKEYPHWDMVSFGPTIRFPHSPDEKINIASVQKFWDYLVESLKLVPSK